MKGDIFSFCGLKSLCFRLKTAEQEKRKTDIELCAARKQIERQKVITEEPINAIEHLRKRLLLVLSVSHYTQCSVISSYSVICFCLLLSFLGTRAAYDAVLSSLQFSCTVPTEKSIPARVYTRLSWAYSDT